MDCDFSPQDCAFRDEVRSFIADHYPARLRAMRQRGDAPGKKDFLAWHRILAGKGWVAPNWPTAWGGPGWTPTRKYIWSEELARADTIPVLPFGIDLVAPALYTFGSRAQQERFLPGTYHGDIWWCQGFAEPDAGSDLASLQTSAVRVGGQYIVNGRKTWTTLAQYADWGCFLVRTDTRAEPQAGISVLLIDMKTPGIAVHPIVTLGGEYDMNDIFLDNVEVPVENRICAENQGWRAAAFMLSRERSGIAGVARSRRGIERIRRMAAIEPGDQSGPLLQDPFFKRKIAELEIDLAALEYTELRALAGNRAGTGAGSALLKIKGTEIEQRVHELALEAAGHYGACSRDVPTAGDNAHPVGPDHAHDIAARYFGSRQASLDGGSSEIQRNIIARMVLGL